MLSRRDVKSQLSFDRASRTFNPTSGKQKTPTMYLGLVDVRFQVKNSDAARGGLAVRLRRSARVADLVRRECSSSNVGSDLLPDARHRRAACQFLSGLTR